MVLHFFDFIIVELLLLLRGNHFVLPTRIGMHTFDLLGIYSTQLTFLTPSRPTGTSGQKSPATRRPSSLRCGFHPISSDSLWHRLFLAAPSPLDLSVPRQHQITESLPQIAWARILERAQRGVGDACYESDEDDFAEEEAQDPERSRTEICRILTGLRGVVGHGVFDRDNHEVRLKYGGYEQTEGQEYANGRSRHEGEYRHDEGERERERRRSELYSSNTSVPDSRRVVAYEHEGEARGRGDDVVDDLEEALLGGDSESRRPSIGRNGYTPVRA